MNQPRARRFAEYPPLGLAAAGGRPMERDWADFPEQSASERVSKRFTRVSRGKEVE